MWVQLLVAAVHITCLRPWLLLSQSSSVRLFHFLDHTIELEAEVFILNIVCGDFPSKGECSKSTKWVREKAHYLHVILSCLVLDDLVPCLADLLELLWRHRSELVEEVALEFFIRWLVAISEFISTVCSRNVEVDFLDVVSLVCVRAEYHRSTVKELDFALRNAISELIIVVLIIQLFLQRYLLDLVALNLQWLLIVTAIFLIAVSRLFQNSLHLAALPISWSRCQHTPSRS